MSGWEFCQTQACAGFRWGRGIGDQPDQRPQRDQGSKEKSDFRMVNKSGAKARLADAAKVAQLRQMLDAVADDPAKKDRHAASRGLCSPPQAPKASPLPACPLTGTVRVATPKMPLPKPMAKAPN